MGFKHPLNAAEQNDSFVFELLDKINKVAVRNGEHVNNDLRKASLKILIFYYFLFIESNLSLSSMRGKNLK